MNLRSGTIEGSVTGPYFDSSIGRYVVNITSPDGHRRNMTWARFKLQEHLGRVLLPREHVDHMDDDKLNDDLGNLQILSPVDNALKSTGPAELVHFECPQCGIEATKKARFVRHNHNLGKAGPFCGRRCAGKYSVNS